MLVDLIPSKYVLSSLGFHGLLLGLLIYKGAILAPETMTLMDPNKGSVEVLFAVQPEEIERELKKHLKKIIEPKKVIDEEGDKIEEPVEQVKLVRQVRLEDIKSLSDLSPEMKAFLKSLRNKIQERQVYPYAAKRLRQTGQVIVKFDVLSNGDVSNVSIEKKSDHKRLDASAVKLVAGISKLSNPPMTTDRISIVLPIEYKL